MKKLLLLFSLLFIGGVMYAQSFSSIKGKVHDDRLKEVNLYCTEDGRAVVCATSRVGSDGSYGFLFSPEAPGFYAVGADRMHFLVYLNGGEEVNLDLYETSAKLNGKNTKENKALYLWEDYLANIRLKSVFFDRTMSTYEDFFPDFEKFLSGLDALKGKLKSGNKAFDESLLKLVDYETDYCAIMFLQTPRAKHPEKSMLPSYYGSIVSADKFTTDDVLQYPDGVRMANSYASYSAMNKITPETRNMYREYALAALNNDRLKGEYIVDNEFGFYKSYDQYLDGMEKYGKYLVTPSLKTRAEAVGTKLYETRAGGQAADFTYPDVNGKMVSLSDFKGKVVLVDVWATWCGPCRGEIPHLKKLEEEMHGKDVVFLGVSVDEAKDKQKWLDFVKKEDLKGVQLHASGWSKIAQDYKIKGIPRFMVFDKQGNIVSVDAPRPSNPALKAMFEKELQK